MNNLKLHLILTGLRSQKKISNRLDKYDKRIYLRKKKQLREPLNTDENVLLMAEQIKKKSVPGKFYKQTVQNIYFNKEKIIPNTKNIDNKTFTGWQKQKQ